MAKQLADDELNIRRKARRRLIGAVALTLAVVVILPMVLDNEPKPAGQDIDLRIPDPDKVGEFVPSVAIPEGSGVSLSADPAVEAGTATVGAPAVAEVAKLPVASSKEPAVENNSRKEAPGKTPAAVSKTPKSKVAETPKPKVAETPRHKVADKPASAAAEGYVAQVGAYSNADTAKQELSKLKKWGFKAYIEKAGDKIRVRVGPYPSREKAEKVGQLLEKHGLHPVILSDK